MSIWQQLASRVLLSLMLLSAFLAAPFHHDHQDDPSHSHGDWLGHSHLSPLHPTSEIEAAETPGQPQDWVAGTVEPSQLLVCVLLCEPAAPRPAEGRLELCHARLPGHDPPGQTHRIPRAPPV